MWFRRRVSSGSPSQASGRPNAKREEVPLGHSTPATTSSRTTYRSRRRFHFAKTPTLTHYVGPPFKIRPAPLGSDFVFWEDAEFFNRSHHVVADYVSFATTFSFCKKRRRLLTPSLLLPKSDPLCWAPILFFGGIYSSMVMCDSARQTEIVLLLFPILRTRHSTTSPRLQSASLVNLDRAEAGSFLC